MPAAERLPCAIPMPQALLSFGEAVVLADVRDREDMVRKDIETGVIPSTHVVRRFQDARLGFPWPYVFTLAAVYREEDLGKNLRRMAVERVSRATTETEVSPVFATAFEKMPFPHTALCHHWLHSSSVAECKPALHDEDDDLFIVWIGKFLKIDLKKVCEDVKPRVGLYAQGLSRIERKLGTLGGEAVFKGTRLPVRHIGGMFDAGDSITEIREDYPYLSESDIQFAHLFFLAHRPVGRPRKSGGSVDAVSDVG